MLRKGKPTISACIDFPTGVDTYVPQSVKDLCATLCAPGSIGSGSSCVSRLIRVGLRVTYFDVVNSVSPMRTGLANALIEIESFRLSKQRAG